MDVAPRGINRYRIYGYAWFAVGTVMLLASLFAVDRIDGGEEVTMRHLLAAIFTVGLIVVGAVAYVLSSLNFRWGREDERRLEEVARR